MCRNVVLRRQKLNAEHTKTIETIHTQVHINTKINRLCCPVSYLLFFQFKCIHFYTSENLRFFIQFFLAPFCTSIQKKLLKKTPSLALRQNLFMHIVLWFMMVYPPLAPLVYDDLILTYLLLQLA